MSEHFLAQGGTGSREALLRRVLAQPEELRNLLERLPFAVVESDHVACLCRQRLESQDDGARALLIQQGVLCARARVGCCVQRSIAQYGAPLAALPAARR